MLFLVSVLQHHLAPTQPERAISAPSFRFRLCNRFSALVRAGGGAVYCTIMGPSARRSGLVSLRVLGLTPIFFPSLLAHDRVVRCTSAGKCFGRSA